MDRHSIQWRLVSAFLFVTLVAVVAVGALASLLIYRGAVLQEQAYLTDSAEAVARQAETLFEARATGDELRDLARTTAFLGNARVRIRDAQERLVADSGPGELNDAMIWVSAPGPFPGLPALPGDSSFIIPLPPNAPAGPPRLPDDPILRNLRDRGDVTIIRRVESPWGSRFVLTGPDETGALPVPPPAPGGPATVPTPAPPNAPPNPPAPVERGQTVAVPILAGGRAAGTVEVSSQGDAGRQALAAAAPAFVVAGLVATTLASLIGPAVSRGLVAPIRGLSAVAGRMAAGDLAARATPGRPDEIGRLAGSFNNMAGQLEQSFADLAAERDALRRFIADMSHELRTPITALRTFNELLESQAIDDPAARADFLAESRAQLDRLEWITRNLLELSRLDAGIGDLRREPVRPADLLDALAASYRRRAEERSIELVTDLTGPEWEISADRARLEIALGNLVDNALKFTPAGGRVTLAWAALATPEGESAAGLTVADTGPGIELEEQPYIFQRFYRGRGSSGDGSGLGLSIAAGITRTHGGRIALESTPGAGSRFTLMLPAAPSDAGGQGSPVPAAEEI